MDQVNTLDGVVAYWAKAEPDRKAIISVRSGEEISYGHLNSLVNYFCQHYENIIGPGKVCALYLDDSIVCHALIHAIFRLGAIVLPLDSELGEVTQTNILSHAEAHFILIGASNINLKFIRNIISSEVRTFDEALVSYQAHLNNASPVTSRAEAKGVAMFAYTSGTTSDPKGVVLQHSHLMAAYRAARVHMCEPQVVGCVFRIATLGTLGIHFFFAQQCGATTILLNRLTVFNARYFWNLYEEYKIDFLYLVPSLVKLLNHFGQPTTKKMAGRIASAGAPLLPTEQVLFQNKFNIALCNIYGLTESSFAVFYGRIENGRGTNDIGPAYRVTTRVVDTEGNDLAMGEVGELWYAGDMVADGYFKNQKATAISFKNKWLRTGDLVKKDKNGYFTIIGRKKDVIIRGGFNIYPIEIEEIILTQEGVVNACVMGIQNDIKGEELLAYVQISPSVSFDRTIFIEKVKRAVGEFRSPDRYLFLKEEVPLNVAGKIDKKKLLMKFDQSQIIDK